MQASFKARYLREGAAVISAVVLLIATALILFSGASGSVYHWVFRDTSVEDRSAWIGILNSVYEKTIPQIVERLNSEHPVNAESIEALFDGYDRRRIRISVREEKDCILVDIVNAQWTWENSPYVLDIDESTTSTTRPDRLVDSITMRLYDGQNRGRQEQATQLPDSAS